MAFDNDPGLAPPGARLERRPDGSRLLRSTRPLGPVPRSLGHLLEHWAGETPERAFLVERRRDGWQPVTYAQALARVRSIAQALLDRGLEAGQPVMVLSGNGVEHALITLAAMHVGIPVAPVSAAYSLVSRDLARLRHAFDLLAPGLVYAADGVRFRRALEALPVAADRIVTGVGQGPGEHSFASLERSRAGPAVDAAFAALGPDTVAKVLLTSGSTSAPKGVINTQRMLCTNQSQIRALWPLLEHRPPVLLDWLPWSHTFGGNHNFNMVLCNGGTLWIDEGNPGHVEPTLEALAHVSPTLYFNVPRGFAALLPRLEADPSLAERFFASLEVVFYAAAALPDNLWQRIEALGAGHRGVRLLSAWGATETAPAMTVVHYPIGRAGNIGVPVPGATLKLVPLGSRLEMRVKGPNVTPGYWRDPSADRAAFDEEGYWRTGDAGRLAAVEDPAAGIVFDGRLTENFKLSSGTWVHTGRLRLAAIAAGSPVIHDAVVAGHDRDEVGLLVFPDLAGCASLCPKGLSEEELLGRDEVREALRAGLAAHNATSGGASERIARVLLLGEPPDIDHNEITDKGYLNQRAVLDRRAHEVERLFGDDPAVVLIPAGAATGS